MLPASWLYDELGSALLSAHLVRDLMRLCFLMEKQYAPYPKWFGTAFARLDCAAEMSPLLHRALRAETWPERETALMAAYEVVAAMHNALNITEPLPTQVHTLHNRPFKVVWADFPGALCAQIQDPAVKRIAEQGLLGSIEQFSDSTALLLGTRWRRPLRCLFE